MNYRRSIFKEHKMSNFDNNDVICKLPSAIIESELDKTLEQYDFKHSQVDVTIATVRGDNYMGILYRITANKNGKKFIVVCKTEPTNEIRREQFRTGIIFAREILVYNDILPLYEEFQLEKGLQDNERFVHYPKCIGYGRGFLFMKDLREEGYKMYDRLKDLDFAHVKLAVETLGKFHAVGFAMKHQRPDYFEKCKRVREEYFGNPVSEGLYDYFRAMFDHSADLLHEDEVELKKKMENMRDVLHEKVPRMLGPDDAEPYAVFTHGDFWNCNIMYKYENDKPSVACLLDYQMSRYASPALDLAYYIFCCTDREFRGRHYEDILRAYHGSFSVFLRQLGNDPAKVFPYEALEDHMRRFGSFGLMIAAVLVKSALSEGDEIPDMDEIAESMCGNKGYAKCMKIGPKIGNGRYEQRMSDVIRDAAAYGMI